MNRISVIALLTLASLAATSGLIAQQPTVQATIPFNFTVGEQAMPAGDYIISSPERNVVMVRSANTPHAAMAVGSESYHDLGQGSKLVFDKYGDRYFLHRILCPGCTLLNMDVALGKVEKRVRTREAKLGTEEQVFVAAR